MTGTTRSSDGLDIRRRRILYRSWHRGTRELDLLLGRFADAWIGDLIESDLDDLEIMMDLPEPQIFSWLTGQETVPEEYNTPVLRKIIAFHADGATATGLKA